MCKHEEEARAIQHEYERVVDCLGALRGQFRKTIAAAHNQEQLIYTHQALELLEVILKKYEISLP